MKINNYLQNLLQHMGLEEEDIKIDLEEKDQELLVNLQVPDEDTGLLIGFRAEVINALQRVLRIIFGKDYPEKIIRLNINNYRQEKQELLLEKIKKIIANLEDDSEYAWPYVSSYERFQIHNLISTQDEFKDYESFSEGEGRERRLVIRKKT